MKLLTLMCSMSFSVLVYHKLLMNKSNSHGNIFDNTTCGRSAYRRGFGQKVISFSFYELDGGGLKKRKLNESTEFPPYFRGIETNLQLSSYYYPSWTVWLYHDLQQGDPLLGVLDSYTSTHDHLDLCHIKSIPYRILKGTAVCCTVWETLIY